MKSMKLVAILFAIILIISCKDDSPTDGGNSSGLATSVNGDQGATGKYTKSDGTSGNATATFINGWDGGQLLNSNFYRLLRINTDIGTFNIRFNMEKGSKFSEIAVGENSFTPYLLLLQETQNLKGHHIEGYFSSGNVFTQSKPFSGTIKIYKDKSYGGTSYSLSGEIDAQLEGTGNTYKSYFWSKDAKW
ncbi:MAG: hypothetical protein CVV25_06565 [Ignavibacteriae bacterium HGW-Ignavibacteriae-4]|jgi:hypothetical protein|nr:MAG: hypothetical protein CVV25_06565 [Ignavibacteriae bacterium HGW-Ignavibacteriae-4]